MLRPDAALPVLNRLPLCACAVSGLDLVCTQNRCTYSASAAVDGAAVLRCSVFIGQGSGKGKEKGMSQKEQQATLAAFRSGEFNVMIATCIAEEGLDIPQVRVVAFSVHRIHPV